MALLIIVGLAIFSYFSISSAKPGFGLAEKQMVWFGVGLVALMFVIFFDYNDLGQLAYVAYAAGVILLALVLFQEERNGASGWFELPLGLSFQPAEIMKVIMVMTLAKIFAMRDEPHEKFYQFIPIFVIIGVPIVLMLLQPDLGNALMFMGIFFSTLFVAGTKMRHFLYIALIIIVIISSLVTLYFVNYDMFNEIIPSHQLNRVLSLINPSLVEAKDLYQSQNALIAVGSGQLMGKGLGQGTQIGNGWVPEPHNDSIFAVIAEEYGFIGSSILILLFFLLIYRMVRIAIEAKDRYGSYLVAGIIGMYVIQIFENIAMMIGIMPLTGITLPFVSYGGTSLLTNFIALGLVINVGMRRKNLMF